MKRYKSSGTCNTSGQNKAENKKYKHKRRLKQRREREKEYENDSNDLLYDFIDCIYVLLFATASYVYNSYKDYFEQKMCIGFDFMHALHLFERQGAREEEVGEKKHKMYICFFID